VLLPKVISYTQHAQYPHWKSNMRFLGQVSEEQWVYSLVSVGRYSQRFMRYMRSRWELGEAWYEEIWLPTACLKMGKEGCSLASFAEGAPDHGYYLNMTHPFRYRPPWPCHMLVRTAVASPKVTLWHPLKARECWLRFLNRCPNPAHQCGDALASITSFDALPSTMLLSQLAVSFVLCISFVVFVCRAPLVKSWSTHDVPPDIAQS